MVLFPTLRGNRRTDGGVMKNIDTSPILKMEGIPYLEDDRPNYQMSTGEALNEKLIQLTNFRRLTCIHTTKAYCSTWNPVLSSSGSALRGVATAVNVAAVQQCQYQCCTTATLGRSVLAPTGTAQTQKQKQWRFYTHAHNFPTWIFKKGKSVACSVITLV